MICARARGPSCAWAWRAQHISRSPRVEDPRPYYQLQSLELSAFGHARSHTAVHRGFECPFFYLFCVCFCFHFTHPTPLPHPAPRTTLEQFPRALCFRCASMRFRLLRTVFFTVLPFTATRLPCGTLRFVSPPCCAAALSTPPSSVFRAAPPARCVFSHSSLVNSDSELR